MEWNTHDKLHFLNIGKMEGFDFTEVVWIMYFWSRTGRLTSTFELRGRGEQDHLKR